MLSQIVAICFGASLGAVLRWLLGIRFNSLFPTIPMGTLAANLIGAYIIGLAVGYFSQAQLGWASATIVVHVSASIILTFAGLFTWQLLKAT